MEKDADEGVISTLYERQESGLLLFGSWMQAGRTRSVDSKGGSKKRHQNEAQKKTREIYSKLPCCNMLRLRQAAHRVDLFSFFGSYSRE